MDELTSSNRYDLNTPAPSSDSSTPSKDFEELNDYGKYTYNLLSHTRAPEFLINIYR